MNRTWLLVTVTAVLVAGCATHPVSVPSESKPIVSSPAIANVSGVWLFIVNTSQGSFDGTMTLAQKGNVISGKVSGEAGDGFVEGSVGDYKINFSAIGANAAKIKFDYTGVIEPDLILGTAKFAQFGDGTWKASWVKNQ